MGRISIISKEKIMETFRVKCIQLPLSSQGVPDTRFVKGAFYNVTDVHTNIDRITFFSLERVFNKETVEAPAHCFVRMRRK